VEPQWPDKPTFAVDWDGTCVENAWPEMGRWLPGAVEVLRELDSLGTVVIHSCRVAPAEIDGKTWRDPEAVRMEVAGIKSMLAEEGLGHIEVWQRPWKPSALVYIDDKAVNFYGNWQHVLDVVEARLAFKKESDTGVEMVVTEEMDVTGLGEFVVPHPSSARFHEILEELHALHDRKAKDYGSDNDPLQNVRASQDWGIPGWVGALIRLNDKVKRLQSFALKGELANESAEDSMRDIAVYAIIALVLYEQESVQ
jgi:hypothetical protein